MGGKIVKPQIKLSQRIVAWIAAALLKLLAKTLRVQIHDQAGFYDQSRKHPLLLCLWHNRILGATLVDARFLSKRPLPLNVLTSASKDGGMLAALVKHFRMGNIRGSSSRRGAAALLESKRSLSEGCDIVITPDGPRGPCYHLAPGILYLAASTATPIVPMVVEMKRFWKFGKRWDAFRMPKPFSTVIVHYLPPITVGNLEDPAAFTAEENRLKAILGEG